MTVPCTDTSPRESSAPTARAKGEDRIIAVLGESTDLGHIVTRAGFVGKWLTKLESPATAFVMMGVSP